MTQGSRHAGGRPARPWDTLSARFILVMMAALILSKVFAVAIVQVDLPRIMAWNVRHAQVEDARRTMTGLGERGVADAAAFSGPPVSGAWSTPVPFTGVNAQTDPQLSARLSEIAGAQVRAAWAPPQPPDGFPEDGARPPFKTVFATLVVSVRAPDGAWVNLAMTPRMAFWPPPLPLVISIVASLAFIAAAGAVGGRRVAQPFRALARGADRLASGERHEALSISGPSDVRRAQDAFNAMAARVEATLAAQSDLLQAIGHDLRTPLTALRVRAALLDDADERGRIDRALDELDRLTEAALAAAAGAAPTEPSRVTDVGALAEAVCEDFQDAGHDVRVGAVADDALVRGWPEDLSRAVRNLVENAVRYGERARVSVALEDGACVIAVDDDGPGIPDAELERVLQPLVRLEPSRSAETGGHGLGLHIAASVMRAHSGALTLENRDGGGLTARLTAPAARP